MGRTATTVATVIGILALLAGAFGTFLFVGFLFAGMPNGSPQLIASLTRWMIIIGVAGVLCAGGAIWLLVIGRPWIGAGVGVAPLVALILFLIIATLS
jgi:hypothetical protein